MKKISADVWAPEIKRLRGDFSQEEFSYFLGVSKSTIQNWESGGATPYWSTVDRIREMCRNRRPLAEEAREVPRRNRWCGEELALHLHQALDVIIRHAGENVLPNLDQDLFERARRFEAGFRAFREPRERPESTDERAGNVARPKQKA
jgi:transcriptional regulator with XRE-family HTH domain